MTKILFMDTEYYNTSAPMMEPVCISIVPIDDMKKGRPKSWWVVCDEDPVDDWGMEDEVVSQDTPRFEVNRRSVREYLDSAHEKGWYMASYNVTAEASFLISCDIDPRKYNWIDLMAEWKLLKNENYSRKYGKYYVQGKKGESIPYPRDGRNKKRNDWGDHTEVGNSLVSCLYSYLGVEPDTTKNTMRDRILKGAPFTEQEEKEILEYCERDISHLGWLFNVLKTEIILLSEAARENKLTEETYLAGALIRGRWSVDLALMEREGIPLDTKRLRAIAFRYGELENAFKSKLVRCHYPFFVKTKGKWVEKDTCIAEYVESKGLQDRWPKTTTGKYKKDDDTLKEFSSLCPEIKAYQSCKSRLSSLRYINPAKSTSGFVPVKPLPPTKREKSGDTLYDRIGKDGNLRAYFNPWGTQTGRNAPPASTFIFAMSSWMRCLIRPKRGECVTGADYGAEEFLIAAMESGDENMMECYDSGDPYLHFAKLAGSAPKDATKKSHPEIRMLFKECILGLQYQLGAVKMAEKVSLSLGRVVPLGEIMTVRSLHKKIFSKYWQWQERAVSSYAQGVPMMTKDGWFLWCDNPNPLSAGNFPIQGAGGAVLRRASKYCHDAGLRVIAPLHDALYIVHDEGKTEESVATLRDCMQRAFQDFYPHKIRIDAKTIGRDDLWVEEKGASDFCMVAQYFLTDYEADMAVIQGWNLGVDEEFVRAEGDRRLREFYAEYEGGGQEDGADGAMKAWNDSNQD